MRKTGNSKRFNKEWDRIMKKEFNEDGTRKNKGEEMRKYIVTVNKTVQNIYKIEVDPKELEGLDEDEHYNYIMNNHFFTDNVSSDDGPNETIETTDSYELEEDKN